ncbi:hypothetical protein IFM89_023560 [Coptis chinensis]|uniref:Transposase n=1 Tax=Coptis chinensis TaxID=261450 RepID=A0A835IEJ4_9MAGN|nr:hypothetical protein IFM89_023560 [Coptis chinensis]
MSRPIQKEWMNELDRFGDVYKQGVADFIQFATVNNRGSTTHLIKYGIDKNYRVWVLHGENPCTDPVVEPVIEEENTEAEGLGMGNFVDASYGVHEVVAGDLNEDEENHMEDFEPPPVLERDLGKRYNEYKKMAEQKLYPSCEAPVTTLSAVVDLHNLKKKYEKNLCTKFRYGKWVLRKDILNKFETLEEQIAACPDGIDPNHWEQFVLYENTPEVMARKAKNGENIKLNDSRHTLGRDTYANMLHKMELVEAAQKKRKNATSSGEGSATHLDFDNDELTEVLGADKRNRTRGISSNLSKKQLKRTSIAKVMLAQARSSSNSEFKGEMSEMKSSITRVEGVLMDMLKLVTNNGMSNSQPLRGDTTPGTDVGSNSVRRSSQ